MNVCFFLPGMFLTLRDRTSHDVCVCVWQTHPDSSVNTSDVVLLRGRAELGRMWGGRGV